MTTSGKIRTLKTVEACIDAIGRERVMALTGRGCNFLWNWQNAGYFSPNTYVVLTDELRRIDCRAPARLWKMIEAKTKKRAA